VPDTKNEPVMSYAPGSPERAELKKEIERMRSEVVDIPMFIDGKEVRTDNTVSLHPPHDRKHLLLVHPRYREEIDYLIKSLSRVRRQLDFDSFERMVAAKILHEGQFLAGSPRVFGAVKQMLEEEGIPEKLARLTERARLNRERAEERLLVLSSELEAGEDRDLFRTREESLEGIY